MIVEDKVRIASRSTHPRWLQRPSILPDELAHGYSHRVLVLNAAESLESLIAEVAKTGAIDPNISKPEFLAWIAEINVADFIWLHTPVPFQRAFAIEGQCHAHGAKLDNHLRHEALRVKVPAFQFCVSCKIEDIDFWGFSFLRVSQHIPGIDYCEKHAQELVSTRFSTSRIANIHLFTWRATPSTPPQRHLVSNQITQRYAEIATALMARRTPIPALVVAAVIATAAGQAGLRRCRNGTRNLLSDLAMEQAPRDWLSRLLPKIHEQKSEPGAYVCSFDRTTKPNVICRPEAYVLALSLLFSDAGEVLRALAETEKNFLTSPPHSPIPSFSAGRSGDSLLLRPQELAKRFAAAGFNCQKMAQALGRSPTRVRELLERVHLPPARLIQPLKNQIALRAFKKGSSIQAACETSGAAVSDLEQLLRCDVDQLVPFLRDR